MAISRALIVDLLLWKFKDLLPEKTKKEARILADDIADEMASEFAGDVYADEEDEALDPDEVDGLLEVVDEDEG